MSDSPFLRAAKLEQEALAKQLNDNPIYKRLQALASFIEEYETLSNCGVNDVENTTAKPKFPGATSGQILTLVAEYLGTVGEATASDILQYIMAHGVTPAGKNPRNSLSANMSHSDRFKYMKEKGKWRLTTQAEEVEVLFDDQEKATPEIRSPDVASSNFQNQTTGGQNGLATHC